MQAFPGRNQYFCNGHNTIRDMKQFLCLAFALTLGIGALAQPGQMPQNVILTARANNPIMYGGPTRAEGRSYNFTPVFFIYPDTKLAKLFNDVEFSSKTTLSQSNENTFTEK